jgi:hypothetical protein
MAFSSAAGTTIYIGPSITSTTDTLAEMQALSPWTEIKPVQSMGEYGDQANDISFGSLSDSRTQHTKGLRDAGTMALTVARDFSDAGQQALIDAEGGNLEWAFKVVYDDALTVSGTGTVEYFRGKVMSKRTNVGSADNVITRLFNIGINSEIFEQDPT